MGLKFMDYEAGGGTVTVPTQQDAADLAEAAVEPWRAFITTGGSLASLFSQWVNLTEIRCTCIGVDGKKNPAIDTQVVTVSGGARGTAGFSSAATPGAGEQPYQVALVATLTGPVYASGAASHGRFYVPGPNLGVDPTNTTYQHLSNGLMTPVATQGWATAMATLLSALTQIEPSSGHITRVSNISTSADAAGIRSQDIDLVTVDNRPDTIRRRSNSIGGQGKRQAIVTAA